MNLDIIVCFNFSFRRWSLCGSTSSQADSECEEYPTHFRWAPVQKGHQWWVLWKSPRSANMSGEDKGALLYWPERCQSLQRYLPSKSWKEWAVSDGRTQESRVNVSCLFETQMFLYWKWTSNVLLNQVELLNLINLSLYGGHKPWWVNFNHITGQGC